MPSLTLNLPYYWLEQTISQDNAVPLNREYNLGIPEGRGVFLMIKFQILLLASLWGIFFFWGVRPF